jgi:hypothetical protein
MTHSRPVNSTPQDLANAHAHQRAQSASSFTGASLTYAASPTSSVSAGGSRGEVPLYAQSLSPLGHQQVNQSSHGAATSRDRSMSVSPKTKMIKPREGSDQENSREYINDTSPVKKESSGQIHIRAPRSSGSSFPSQYSGPTDANAQIHRESQISSADQSRMHPRASVAETSAGHPSDHERTSAGHPTMLSQAALNGGHTQSPMTLSPHDRPNPLSRQPSFNSSHSQMGGTRAQSMTQSPTNKPRPRPTDSQIITNPVKTKTLSMKRDRSQAPSTPDSATSQKPHKKRRYEEPPIWAQRAKNSNKTGPVPGQRNYQGQVNNTRRLKSEAIARPQQMEQKRQDTNGFPTPERSSTLPQPSPDLGSDGPLGAWEPTFTNVIPSEELTRSVMDFLFKQVVMREDADGPSASGTAVLEVEAKIGQLIDRNTNERIRLPVTTECVVSPHDPSIKLAFKSSMTVVCFLRLVLDLADCHSHNISFSTTRSMKPSNPRCSHLANE